MASLVEVRPVQSRDLDRILEIEQASFGRDAWDRDLFLEYFRRCPDLFLVARSARRIGGYIITCTDTKSTELVSIAVDPRDRLRGLGRAMLAETLGQLRSRRVKTWWLMVATSNDPAIRFYESYGFVRTRRSKRYYGTGRDAWRMKLKI
ncbi:MAG TPA: ribosomal protein S18-alanine N-acetyltransferase [Bryobacteraceae bacterium]|nr:ribosomal protein S18-alanine N-acetyltransferase [Bryobacteraceae bacterium]